MRAVLIVETLGIPAGMEVEVWEAGKITSRIVSPATSSSLAVPTSSLRFLFETRGSIDRKGNINREGWINVD